jgi:hypothetical protein
LSEEREEGGRREGRRKLEAEGGVIRRGEREGEGERGEGKERGEEKRRNGGRERRKLEAEGGVIRRGEREGGR